MAKRQKTLTRLSEDVTPFPRANRKEYGLVLR